jgi:hypothetical protein
MRSHFLGDAVGFDGIELASAWTGSLEIAGGQINLPATRFPLNAATLYIEVYQCPFQD